MSGKWTACRAHLSPFTLLILVLRINGCSALNYEGLALLQFRAKVNFDPSGALANWYENDCSPCMWLGVRCLDNKVHMLDLNGYQLEGVLAPELGNLPHLRVLNLSKNHFLGAIPQELGRLATLEVLDLRDNKLSGTIPSELGQLQSLKRLLLCNNSFEQSIHVEIPKLGLLANSECDDVLTTVPDQVSCMNRKFGHGIWPSVLKHSDKSYPFPVLTKGDIIRYLRLLPLFKFATDQDADDSHSNLTDLPPSGVIWNVDNEVANVHRVLAEKQPSNLPVLPKIEQQPNNLPALPANHGPPPKQQPVSAMPSRSSGSFPAVPKNQSPTPSPAPAPAPPTPPAPTSQEHTTPPVSANQTQPVRSAGLSVALIITLSLLAFLLVAAAAVLFIWKSRAARNITPWKTGLSGQLQKALITGVPKLNRDELETACEDFSNIIHPDNGVCTVYKGTLSSGVEIAVISTAIGSLKDWSKRSELIFRKKIDTLSRVNHKNFLNLIGYCEEDEPFTRMMVLEYAPNGTVYEHLHDQEVEHLDWNARMRIIMGTAYCLQHMHDLNPPLASFNVTSKEILLTDDYAAKIADLNFWSELISKSKNSLENEASKSKSYSANEASKSKSYSGNEASKSKNSSGNEASEHSELPLPADVETNVHSFGMLMLEIISGKLPYSEEQGHLASWAAKNITDKKSISCLVDPSLKSFTDDELDVVCEVIQNCIQQEAEKRPSMKEVIQRLREVVDISPEHATPRLSPLWWAELEILSAEAA